MQRNLRPVKWEQRKRRLTGWRRRLLWLAWTDWWLQRVAFRVRAWGITRVLEIAATFTVVFAAYSYLRDVDDRRKERHFQAWQVITASEGKGGNAGRIDALQDLVRDGVPLNGVNLAGAWLEGVDLSGGRLAGTRLDSAILRNANLRHADLTGASLVSADLEGADLQNAIVAMADLRGANLSGATLRHTSLAGADMQCIYFNGADLSGADLVWANLAETAVADVTLSNARLSFANMRGARLQAARIDGADFTGTDMRGAHFVHLIDFERVRSMRGANIHAATGWIGFDVWAKNAGAVVAEERDIYSYLSYDLKWYSAPDAPRGIIVPRASALSCHELTAIRRRPGR